MGQVETLDKCIHSYLFLDIKYLWKSRVTRMQTTSPPFGRFEILCWDLTSFTHHTSAFKNPASEHIEHLGGVEIENTVTLIGSKAPCKCTNNNCESMCQPWDTAHDKIQLVGVPMSHSHVVGHRSRWSQHSAPQLPSLFLCFPQWRHCDSTTRWVIVWSTVQTPELSGESTLGVSTSQVEMRTVNPWRNESDSALAIWVPNLMC